MYIIMIHVYEDLFYGQKSFLFSFIEYKHFFLNMSTDLLVKETVNEEDEGALLGVEKQEDIV